MKIKVLESSLQKLVLQVQPIGIAYWLAGVTFIGCGILVAAIFGRSVLLTCNKNDAGIGKCQLQQSRMFESSTQEWALSDLKGAKFDPHSTDEFFGKPLILETQTREFRLTLIMADPDKKRSLAGQINQFLESNATNKFKVEENIKAISYSLGGLLCIAGIFNILLILLNGKIVLTLDRLGNRISVVNHRLFSNRIWSASLSDLLRLEAHGVGVAEMSDPMSYKVHLVMQSGEHISLGLLPLFSKAKANELSNHVYDFLNQESTSQK
jgi:hypothetical protein